LNLLSIDFIVAYLLFVETQYLTPLLPHALAWKPREIPLGEGEVDFKTIFKGLKDVSYSGWWNFEGHATIDPIVTLTNSLKG
jgi:L-ribulose-5-phosphate 3-epimerase UlaE